ncbi:transmembrane protein 267 [Plutella xylostella]|uniref:transmembrane protein 267 n=1 Tax=Plutella xylostella TaxID=51655 RepID=UPI00203311EF|nr:transmembrane protein 267 [Plutella xylostella]
MKHAREIVTLLIAFTAFFGDYVVFQSKLSNSKLLKALADSAVHGILGCLSALAFLSNDTNYSTQTLMYNVMFCTLISCLIDVDHIFVAKSFSLQDLTNTKSRGFLHCTSLWLFVTISLLTYSYITKKVNIFSMTWMLILAFSSHHIRDGNRRGLWMYPFGHTPPIPKYLYIGLTMFLPHLLAVIYRVTKPTRHTVLDYSDVVTLI